MLKICHKIAVRSPQDPTCSGGSGPQHHSALEKCRPPSQVPEQVLVVVPKNGFAKTAFAEQSNKSG